MFKMPENILEFFFVELKKKGKYNTIFEGNSAFIEAKEGQQYYKPLIIVKDINDLETALIEYVNELNRFYEENNNLEKHHDLSFFFNNLLTNMTSSDAQDLTSYIYRRIEFFKIDYFSDLDNPTLLKKQDGVNYYVQRVLESPGLETPYVLVFYMEVDGIYYNLPLIRYAFDRENTCHLFAVQFGRDRVVYFDETYKGVVNKVNTGVTKYRNVSPGFVLSLQLFLELLKKMDVSKIMVPDFLFGRYRKYIGASSISKSHEILERILNNFIRLLQRMEYQSEDFKIEAYPNDIDSFTHISLGKQNNLKRTLEKEND